MNFNKNCIPRVLFQAPAFIIIAGETENYTQKSMNIRSEKVIKS